MHSARARCQKWLKPCLRVCYQGEQHTLGLLVDLIEMAVTIKTGFYKNPHSTICLPGLV